jgi:hypothetical protein
VRTNFNPEFVHSLRWKNVAGLTEKLFGKKLSDYTNKKKNNKESSNSVEEYHK